MQTEISAAMMELSDASLYEREARLLREKIIDGGRIGERFERFAEEERSHLEALKQIFPGLESSLQKNEAVAPGNSLRAILRTHAARELQAIRAYEELLRRPLAPLHALLIKGILTDERRHLETVIHCLKNLR